MSSERINTNQFDPRKAGKRVANEAMDVEMHNGIEGRNANRPSQKRMKMNESKEDLRKIPVPAHRYTPLKENWLKIFTPIVELLQLNIRFNLKTRNVEIKVSEETKDIGNLQKAADFVKVICHYLDLQILT